jgi:hypothetical protein
MSFFVLDKSICLLYLIYSLSAVLVSLSYSWDFHRTAGIINVLPGFFGLSLDFYGFENPIIRRFPLVYSAYCLFIEGI